MQLSTCRNNVPYMYACTFTVCISCILVKIWGTVSCFVGNPVSINRNLLLSHVH